MCRKFFILFIILLSSYRFVSIAQVNTTKLFIDSVEEYEVIEPKIFNVIDTVLSYMNKCESAFIFQKSNLLWIVIYDTNSFMIENCPYSSSLVGRYRYDSRTNQFGFFYYKEHLVLVSSFLSDFVFRFFKSTKIKQNIEYINSRNLLDHIMGAYTNIQIPFYFEDGKLIFEDFDVPSARSREFYYYVEHKDTWDIISKIIGCPKKILTTNFYDSSQPIEGSLIMVKYIIDSKIFIRIQ